MKYRQNLKNRINTINEKPKPVNSLNCNLF